MIRNAAFAATAILLAFAVWLFGALDYLIPYKRVLLAHYLPAIGWYLGLLWINLVAAMFLFTRVLFLKDTGRKLAHLDRQLRSGDSISEDLTARIEAE